MGPTQRFLTKIEIKTKAKRLEQAKMRHGDNKDVSTKNVATNYANTHSRAQHEGSAFFSVEGHQLAKTFRMQWWS